MTQNIKKDFGKKPDQTAIVWGKLPPQAIEMEQAVIGACLLERDSFEQVMEILPSHECFYKDAHQKIYFAMCELYNSGSPVDLLTVSDTLTRKSEIELIGGNYFLNELTSSVLTTAHIQTHARIVMEKHMLREVIREGGRMVNEAYSESADVFELMETAESNIKSISDGIVGGNDVPVGYTYGKMLKNYEEQKKNKSEVIGITSGYTELDSMILGWDAGNLIILAARPSQGKTAIAINFAMNAKVPTLIFSLESSEVPLVRRMSAAKNNIPLDMIRRGILNDFQEKTMYDAQMDFNRLPIRIDSKTRTLGQIKKAARAWVKKMRKMGHTKLLIEIDYLQLMSVQGKGNREQEISTISRELKELAEELQISIIALSQLNRDVEKTSNKKPGLANLRESGSLEQDANIVMMIWWEDTEERSPTGENVMKTWIIVPKNREGKTGEVQLKFNGDIQKWLDINDINYQAVPASSVKTAHYRDPSQAKQTNWDEPF